MCSFVSQVGCFLHLIEITAWALFYLWTDAIPRDRHISRDVLNLAAIFRVLLEAAPGGPRSVEGAPRILNESGRNARPFAACGLQ